MHHHRPLFGWIGGASFLSIDIFSQAEIWLELITDDVEAAADYLDSTDTVRKDEIEPLPEGFDGFWICNPADVIHLVSLRED